MPLTAVGTLHGSEQTAAILTDAGKAHWLQQRADMVEAKGLGKLRTFWLKGIGDSTDGNSDCTADDVEADDTTNKRWHDNGSESVAGLSLSTKDLRLVDWNVEILGRLLRQIAAKRRAVGQAKNATSSESLKVMEERCTSNDVSVFDL